MELAGERFSDRPRSVSPDRGLLREYNDAVDDERHQALVFHAALQSAPAPHGRRSAPGRRRRNRVDRRAARRCVRWAAERAGGRRGLWRVALTASAACRCAARVAHGRGVQFAAVRELLDELIGPTLTSPTRPIASPRAARDATGR